MPPSQTLRAGRDFVRDLRRNPWFRRVLLYCLPALIIGLVFRGILLWRMPNAFYHSDSYTVFETFRAWKMEGLLHFHAKKTALVPLLYSGPLALHWPVLPIIAVVQHTLGLLLIALVGFLVAFSFRHWKALLIPATLLVAIDPVILWYEHLSLPESLYVLLVTAVALSGLLFYKYPRRLTLTALLTSLFLAAAARPEGKLWCFFGAALVLRVYWPKRKQAVIALAGMLAFTVICFVLNRTSQSGSLLYSNVAHLTPDHLRCAPGFVEVNTEYLDDLRERWKVVPTKIPRERREIMKRVKAFLTKRDGGKAPASHQADQLCGKMAFETCIAKAWQVPRLALMKFRFGLREPTAEGFGEHWVHQKQLSSFAGAGDDPDEVIDDNRSAEFFARTVLGREFHSHGELGDYLGVAYRPFAPDWLTPYNRWFQHALLAIRLPDTPQPSGETIPGFPILFILAAAGLLAQAVREKVSFNYYYLWLGALLFMVLVLALTGSNKGRFRIVFEPFLFLYLLALVDVVMDWITTLRRKREVPPLSRS